MYRYYSNFFSENMTNHGEEQFRTLRLAKEAAHKLPEDYAYVIRDYDEHSIVAYRTSGILTPDDFIALLNSMKKV